MASAKNIIENTDPDSPESFGVGKYLDSPVARIAATNGFKLDNRKDSNEERWVKKLSNGREVWLRTTRSREFEIPMDFKKGIGGREWELVEMAKTGKLYSHVKVLIRTNEVAMTYVLGAFLQRLATWPADMPKPTLEALPVPDPDDPAAAVSSFVKSKTPYLPDYAALARIIAEHPEIYIEGQVKRTDHHYVHERSTDFNLEMLDMPPEVDTEETGELANRVEKQIGEEIVRINKKIYRALERESDYRNSDEYLNEWLGDQGDDQYNALGDSYDDDDAAAGEQAFSFNELDEEGKAHARDNYRNSINYDEWWDHTLEEWTEELKDMGFDGVEINFTGFASQGDGASFTAKSFDFLKWAEWHMSNKPIERGHPYTDDLPPEPVAESVDEPSKEHLIHMGRAGECDQPCNMCGAFCTLIHYDLNGTQMPQYHICQTCDTPLTELGLNADEHAVGESGPLDPLKEDKETDRIRKRVNKIKAEREAAELAANPEVQKLDDPTAFLSSEVAKRSEPIKKLEVRGRRWFRRGAGGVYCKAYIYINDKLVHVTPEQYGYNDHYLTLAKDWLMRNGYLEGLLDDERDPLWIIRDKHKIDLQYGVTDVPRERDL